MAYSRWTEGYYIYGTREDGRDVIDFDGVLVDSDLVDVFVYKLYDDTKADGGEDFVERREHGKQIIDDYKKGIYKRVTKNYNGVLGIIANRFSCRNFTDRMPRDWELSAIANAGLHAPSGMNRQNWQIIVVKNRALIAEMEVEGMRVLAELPDKTMLERIKSRGGKLFYNAPCMVMLAVKDATPKGAELIDLGIVVQNIALAATSLGIDNCHCGLAAFSFAGGKSEDFKAKLKFPQGYEVGLAVLLGYAEKPSAPHKPDQDKITVIG